ncbi:MAG TPA: 23S rRNA (adenine(2503)-C(2))-methyltransferase RlmN [Thermoanaerobaculia bacterium]|nr:23S rRNA (adenine(2503)-C(2))-methyltransferase RlmN [Thermoanaerobaculia bacterium]
MSIATVLPTPTPAPVSSSAGDPRPALLGLPLEELATVLAPAVDRPFRARQVYDALHRRAVAGFEEMTDLPAALRQRLAREFRVGGPEVVERAASDDGTVKYLLALADGATVEAVDIPDGERRTFCISSQAGCGLACKFCVTGYWGAGRNLTAGEIVGQVLAIRRDRGLPPSGFNLVFMGMGEPLLNLGGLEGALAVLGESLSLRRITVSTAGVVPGIDAMARWPRRPNLAVSLHAPDDERRSELMPINRSYPLAELLAALERYPLERGRKLTIEYLLIEGFNDAAADADALARRLRGLRAKVNLIPVNPDPVLGPEMVPPPDARVDAFRARLERRGLVATVRRRRGDDVSAACGQLRAFGRDPRGFRAGLHGTA